MSSFDLIFSTFVVTGSAALTVVETLLGTLPALALIVGATPLFVISDIKKQFKEFKKRCGNLQSDEKERANKVITRVEKLIADADKAVKESAELIDQTILDDEDIDPSVTAIREPEYAFNMIRDIMKESNKKRFAHKGDSVIEVNNKIIETPQYKGYLIDFAKLSTFLILTSKYKQPTINIYIAVIL